MGWSAPTGIAGPGSRVRCFCTASTARVELRVPLREAAGGNPFTRLHLPCPSQLVLRVDRRDPRFATHGLGPLRAEQARSVHASHFQKPCIGEQIGYIILQLVGRYVVRKHVEHVSRRTSRKRGQVLMLSTLNGEPVGLPFTIPLRRLELKRDEHRPRRQFGKEVHALLTFLAPRRSVEDTNAARCVEQYLECLTEHNAMQSSNRDKSFAHAYLAGMKIQ